MIPGRVHSGRGEPQYVEDTSVASEKPRRMKFESLRRFFDLRGFLCMSEGEANRTYGDGEKEKAEMTRNLCPLVVSMYQYLPSTL